MPKVINLSQNENLYGFPRKILPKIYEILRDNQTLSIYHKESKLRQKLSQKHQVKESQVFIESGAEGALHEIFASLSHLPKSKILLSNTCWDYYKELAKKHKIAYSFYKLKENKANHSYEFDLNAIYEAIKEEKPAAIIINSPNNPLGHKLDEKDLQKLVQNISQEIILIFDETYFGFSTKEDSRGKLIRQYPNLIFIRSFSKYYALAGLRIGYVLTGDFARDKLNIYANYLGNNFISEEIAGMVLGETKYYQSVKEKINTQKDILYNFYNMTGFSPYKGEANFILVRLPQQYNNIEYAKYMAENGYLIKVFTTKDLQNCIRIAIPTQTHTKKVIALTEKFLAKK